jgi:SAM-dependent methyltransferase
MRDIPLYKSSAYAWQHFRGYVQAIVAGHGYRRVADIGGGRNPLFSPREAAALGIDYTIVDISRAELARAPRCFRKICADATALEVRSQFDLVFSMMFCEHVDNVAGLHRSLRDALRPGGEAVHFFPTLYALPFAINALLPDRLAKRLLLYCRPNRGDTGAHPKFKALYKACRGPSPYWRRYYESFGYDVVEHKAFYGHNYFDRVPVVRGIDRWLSRRSCERDDGRYCSYAYLRLRKPAVDDLTVRNGIAAIA